MARDKRQRSGKPGAKEKSSALRRKPRPPSKKIEESEPITSNGSFPIVGIGASAGGLEAFTDLLSRLPTDTGMGFVLVQHLDPAHESALTKLLSKATSIPVTEVTNNTLVAANHVYVIPPNRNMTIDGGVLKLAARKQSRGAVRSIDSFLESLAADQHEWAIGVILSGTATDGTLGLEAIKGEGGITFAQDDSAKYDSMPRSAVAAGCVDFVLSPQQIADELVSIAKHPSVASRIPADRQREGLETLPGPGEDPLPDAEAFKKILLLVRNHAGVDFSLYKSSTIQRRIRRRMVLNRHHDLDEYARFLREQANEMDQLYSDMLIAVTSFFRNPEGFEILKQEVFPKLLAARTDNPVRVWVLGCSTGQEAYSIAMNFLEAAETAPHTRRLQVFATDLNEALLAKARNGLYAKTLVQDISRERLRRFFVEEEGGYRVSKELRQMVVFARQNVLSDPPFSHLDLISCRNLLIYLEADLQRRVVPMFHYALNPNGYLFLGASESVSTFGTLFETVNKKYKIFKKKPGHTPEVHLAMRREHRPDKQVAKARPAAELPEGFRTELNAQREADRITIGRFAPPSLLINAESEILQFRGDTGPYLKPPTGKATFNVLKMAREGLMLPLRAAINRAKKENKPARKENVRVQQNGVTRVANLEVIPLKNLTERSYLILFEELDGPVTKKIGLHKKTEKSETLALQSLRVAELERELAETRDYLQSVQEQYEAANEELQAQSEEVQSANEELQSINEELETSKEELESANEELITVNEEMINRNAELTRLNSDVNNLIASINTPILVLGLDLTIRRFTPAAEKPFNVLAGDVGRPLASIRHHLNFPGLERLVFEVIDSVQMREQEVQDKGGHWYLLRARPYMTVDKKIDGAVIVLSDIDAQRRAQEANAKLAAIVQTSEDAIETKALDGTITSWNPGAERLYGYSAEEIIGKNASLLYPPDQAHEWTTIVARVERGEPVQSLETMRLRKDGRRISVSLSAAPVLGPGGEIIGVSVIARDITERKRLADALQMAAEFDEAVMSNMAEGLYTVDSQGLVTSMNPAAEEMFGWTLDELRGRKMHDITHHMHPDGSPFLARDCAALEVLRAGKTLTNHEDVFIHKDGTFFDVVCSSAPLRAGEEITGLVVVFHDVTARRKAEAEREELHGSEREARAAAELANQVKDEFLGVVSHELRTPLNAIVGWIEMLKSGHLDPPTVQRAIDTIERNAKSQAAIINDLLDTSRIISGKLKVEMRPTDLVEVINEVVEVVRPAAAAKAIKILTTFDQKATNVAADPLRLQQVIWNLLSNAVKFTPKGGQVEVRLKREHSDMAILIKDNGEGISADLLPRVFERFQQADTTPSRRHEGLGLGLAIVRQLVQMHGGTIRAESKGVGKGATFTITLPIPAISEVITSSDGISGELLSLSPAGGPEGGSANVTSELLAGLRVLAVDDQIDTRDLIILALTKYGAEVKACLDARSAFKMLLDWKPDIIVSDISMPGEDGYQLMRKIRALKSTRDSQIPAIALTGYGGAPEVAKAINAGYQTHLTKPVRLKTLAATIAKLAGR